MRLENQAAAIAAAHTHSAIDITCTVASGHIATAMARPPRSSQSKCLRFQLGGGSGPMGRGIWSAVPATKANMRICMGIRIQSQLAKPAPGMRCWRLVLDSQMAPFSFGRRCFMFYLGCMWAAYAPPLFGPVPPWHCIARRSAPAPVTQLQPGPGSGRLWPGIKSALGRPAPIAPSLRQPSVIKSRFPADHHGMCMRMH